MKLVQSYCNPKNMRLIVAIKAKYTLLIVLIKNKHLFKFFSTLRHCCALGLRANCNPSIVM